MLLKALILYIVSSTSQRVQFELSPISIAANYIEFYITLLGRFRLSQFNGCTYDGIVIKLTLFVFSFEFFFCLPWLGTCIIDDLNGNAGISVVS